MCFPEDVMMLIAVSPLMILSVAISGFLIKAMCDRLRGIT